MFLFNNYIYFLLCEYPSYFTSYYYCTLIFHNQVIYQEFGLSIKNWTFLDKTILQIFVFFLLQAELLDGVCKFNLKPDSIPTIFSHARPLKHRTSSIKHENDRKKAFLKKAISGQSTESEFQSVSIEKPSEKLFHSIGKAIDCTPKVKDVKIQYSLSHCYHSISKKPAVKPTFVKIPPKKRPAKHQLIQIFPLPLKKM